MLYQKLIEEFRITDTLTDHQLRRIVDIHEKLSEEEKKKAWNEGYKSAFKIYVEQGEIAMTCKMSEIDD